MIHTIDYLEHQFKFERYPFTQNRSLQAWNAGDQYVLEYLESLNTLGKSVGIYLDRFGFLSVMLKDLNPISIVSYASQSKAYQHNFKLNEIEDTSILKSIFDDGFNLDMALLKMPKSMDLFEFYLKRISENLSEDGEVIVSFMTKAFTKQSIEIAESYFESVEQTLAFKKSRLMILKGKKSIQKSLINKLEWNETTYQQHFGVFSGKHIDYATQFLLEIFKLEETEKEVLDLASGNGVIAKYLVEHNTIEKMHLIDDDYLAMDSAKMNCESDVYQFHTSDDLSVLEDESIDLVISNPPFHFDNENNIEVSIGLFQQVKEKMKASGRFVLVANKHLNYWTHLEPLFPNTEVIAIDDKFEVYECRLQSLISIIIK